MVGLFLKCEGCGFENPRGWVCCARCDQLLGPPSFVLRSAFSSTADSQSSIQGSDSTKKKKKRVVRRTPTFLVDRNDSSDNITSIIGQQSAIRSIQLGTMTAFTKPEGILVALQGDTGSGKTRLLIYAAALAAKQYNDVKILYSFCRTADDGPYAPFSRLLLECFGITPASSPTSVRKEMAKVVGQILQTQDSSLVSETTHLLGHMAGVPFPDSPILRAYEKKPFELHARTIHATRRFFEGYAGDCPILFLLDDMEKADNEVWDLLNHMINSMSATSVVVAGRDPLFKRTRDIPHRLKVIESKIEPFNKNDVTKMIKVLVPELVSVPEPLIASLSHRSQGNPSALKELIQGLLESDLFIRTDQGLEVDLQKIEDGAHVLTMDDVVRARRDTLNTFERSVIERAVVVGENFWDGAILAIIRSEKDQAEPPIEPLEVWPDDKDEVGLSQILSELEERGFIVCIGKSEISGLNEYTFQHSITRNVIYNDIPKKIRAQHHVFVARWLSMIAPPRPDKIDSLTAQHLELAGLSGRAGRFFLKAATKEHRHMRTTVALRHVKKALPLIELEDIDFRMNAMHEHGSLLALLGRFEEAEEAFQEMLHLAWTIGAKGKAGAAFNRIARIYRSKGEYKKSLVYLQRALRLFREANDQRGIASTFDDMAQVHRLQGNLEAALVSAKEALDSRFLEKDRWGQALSLNTMGHIMLDSGDLITAKSRLDAALQLRISIGDHEGAVQSRTTLGRLSFFQKRYDEAITIYQVALESAREMANRHSQSILLNYLGEAYLETNELQKAYMSLTEAREISEQIDDQYKLAEIECNLGLVALKSGSDHTRSILKNALEVAKCLGVSEVLARVRRAIGRFESQTLYDDSRRVSSNAENSYKESIKIFEECGNRYELAYTLSELGFHLIERGDSTQAHEVLQYAYNTMCDLDLPEQKKIKDALNELSPYQSE